jgi:hypothetical protein
MIPPTRTREETGVADPTETDPDGYTLYGSGGWGFESLAERSFPQVRACAMNQALCSLHARSMTFQILVDPLGEHEVGTGCQPQRPERCCNTA